MKCNCCNGHDSNCTCKCHRIWSVTKGLFVIIIGMLWLADNNGWIEFSFGQWILPIIVILIGVKLLCSSCHHSCGSSKNDDCCSPKENTQK